MARRALPDQGDIVIASTRWTLFSLAGLLLITTGTSASATQLERWLSVDTAALTLTVIEDGLPQMTLHNLAIGRYGTSPTKRRGDNTTPLGSYRITGIRRDSGFHRFIALDYPGIDRARTANREGLIDSATLQRILDAHRRGDAPPQNTALGGHIGIHGLGSADPQLHKMLNWTRGCVALTDRQIDALLPWLKVGMKVEIR